MVEFSRDPQTMMPPSPAYYCYRQKCNILKSPQISQNLILLVNFVQFMNHHSVRQSISTTFN